MRKCSSEHLNLVCLPFADSTVHAVGGEHDSELHRLYGQNSDDLLQAGQYDHSGGSARRGYGDGGQGKVSGVEQV